MCGCERLHSGSRFSLETREVGSAGVVWDECSPIRKQMISGSVVKVRARVGSVAVMVRVSLQKNA